MRVSAANDLLVFTYSFQKKKKDMVMTTTSPLVLQPYSDLDNLLNQLARWCLINNFYRHENEFRDFDADEVDHINATCLKPSKIFGKHKFKGGYIFLDESNGASGLVRLYLGDCNPKWWFERKNDGSIEVDLE